MIYDRLIAASILSAALILLAPHSPAHASARAPVKSPVSFEGSPGWAKADLRSREAWQGAISAGEPARQLDCIMKVKGALSKRDSAALKDAGFIYRTLIGTIITGSVAAGDFPAVANLEFVQAIELSVPMSIKKGAK